MAIRKANRFPLSVYERVSIKQRYCYLYRFICRGVTDDPVAAAAMLVAYGYGAQVRLFHRHIIWTAAHWRGFPISAISRHLRDRASWRLQRLGWTTEQVDGALLRGMADGETLPDREGRTPTRDGVAL